jgi:diadenosine tetraphosphatase ApaH/serine/threonine PP2A family protein phosphatase
LQYFNENARTAIKWTQNVLTDSSREYLTRLPLILKHSDMQIVHGSLRSPLSEYIDSIANAIPCFAWMKGILCFAGHTHKPIFLARHNNHDFSGKFIKNNEEVLVGEYQKTIINPGSVGQPRDKDAQASFGIYNSTNKIFSLHRVEYDIKTVQAKMKQANLPQFLIDRLRSGQ